MARLLLVLTLLLSGCHKQQDECGFLMINGERIVWKKFPIQIVSMDSSFDTPLRKAMSTWNKEAGYELFEFHPDGAVITYEDPWSYDNNVWAFARLFYTQGRMVNVMMFVNPKVATSPLDKESLFLHELGHFLGLGHSDDTNSVMYPVLKTYDIKRKLTEQDRINFQCGYRRRD